MPDIWRRFSVWAILVANLVPLYGAVFLQWDLFSILFAYWMETAVIGFWTIAKIVYTQRWLAILIAPFFVFHYGAFMFGHLIFLVGFFSPEGLQGSFLPSFPVFTSYVLGLLPAFATAFIAHGISFFTNFIGKKEYERLQSKDVMQSPYKRIILMHIAIIFGGWLIMLSGTSVAGFAVFIVLKTALDIRAHLKEHAALTANV
jgi:hypothetical protein